MAAKSEQDIKSEIKTYIDRGPGNYQDWYVGIATDAEQRLFSDHNVDKAGYWIYRLAATSEVARRIEEYFLNVVGTDGGPGGGSDDTKYVYAYKKERHTKE